jgi:hypothetical protein
MNPLAALLTTDCAADVLPALRRLAPVVRRITARALEPADAQAQRDARELVEHYQAVLEALLPWKPLGVSLADVSRLHDPALEDELRDHCDTVRELFDADPIPGTVLAVARSLLAEQPWYCEPGG